MNLNKLEKTINESFEKKEKVNLKSDKKIIKAIKEMNYFIKKENLSIKEFYYFFIRCWIKFRCGINKSK